MNKEIQALEANATWSFVPLPFNKHCIDCWWIYKIEIDFSNTFSPIAKLTSIHVLFTIVDEVYMELPKCFHTTNKELVCKLNKSFNELRQTS
ncbi:hypothetical protein CR513_40655, partial [Mucuna pruriens]